MRTSPMILVAVAAATLPALVLADEFPNGATTLPASDLTQRISGKVFDVTLKDGTKWRLQFASNGYFYIDVSNGFRGSGTWKSEDGKLCSQLRGGDPSCNEVRLHDGHVHLKRTSGEVVKYVPRD